MVDGGVVVVDGGTVVVAVADVVVEAGGVVVVVDSGGFDFGTLPGLSKAVVVVVVSTSGVPRSTDGSSVALGSIFGAIPAPAAIPIEPPSTDALDRSCGEPAAPSHAGSPPGAESPLIVSAGNNLSWLRPMLNVWPTERHRVAVPAFFPVPDGHVTRTPIAIVALPPSFGHNTVGLVTETALDVIQPVPPIPVFGMVMTYANW